MNNERAQRAQDCLKAAKLLYSRFMVNAYEGNVSVRLGDSILVTPSAVCKEELEADDLVEVDIEMCIRDSAIQNGLRTPPKDSFDAYIGIPFCKTRCAYCSFSAGEIGDGHLAVSYTHLDVYKRQENGLPASAATSRRRD